MKAYTRKLLSTAIAFLVLAGCVNNALEAKGYDVFADSQGIAAVSETETSNSDETEYLFVPDIDYQIEPLEDNPVSYMLNRLDNSVMAALPSAYSSHELGYISGVQSQGSDGTCWIFAGVSALESCLLKNQVVTSVDISEEQAKCSGFKILGGGEENPYGYYMSDTGGSFDSFVELVLNGVCLVEEGNKYREGYRTGPENAELGAFKNGDPLPAVGEVVLAPDYNLLKTNWIYKDYTMTYDPEMNNLVALNETQRNDLVNRLKQAVYDYGAVYSCMNAGTILSDGKFVCITEANWENNPNHAITIVGWDDSIDKSLFRPGTPENNGAFLCKNSWGGTGEIVDYKGVDTPSGYFWLSYEDVNCGSSSAVVCGAELADSNQVTYLYGEDSCIRSSFAYPSEYDEVVAAKYETRYLNERIDSVGFMSMAPGIEYEISIATAEDYKSSSPSYLESCEKTVICTGTTDNCGYYTAKIPSTAPVIDDPVFYVIVTMKNYHGFAKCGGLFEKALPDTNFVYELDYSTYSYHWKEVEDIHLLKVNTIPQDSGAMVPIRFFGGKGSAPEAQVTISIEGQEPQVINISQNDASERYMLPLTLEEGQVADITISRDGYTGYSIKGYTMGRSHNLQDVVLYAGDINGDGNVNFMDFSLMVVAINSNPVIGEDNAEIYGVYDFNADGYINTFDISRMVKSVEALYNISNQ